MMMLLCILSLVLHGSAPFCDRSCGDARFVEEYSIGGGIRTYYRWHISMVTSEKPRFSGGLFIRCLSRFYYCRGGGKNRLESEFGKEQKETSTWIVCRDLTFLCH
jgi:hypothetical protein